jgi:hypothetical protein
VRAVEQPRAIGPRRASASSCSLACSTTPSHSINARTAFGSDTGAPIWIADASVGRAVRAA